MRALGVDLGAKRIGVALCDRDGRLATPYETVHRSGSARSDHLRLAALVEEAGAEAVVVGLPISLDGTDGPAATAARAEADAIADVVGVPVTLQDERLSTVTAERALTEQGVKPRRRRQIVDQMAAAVILQTWLDAGGPAALARD